MISLLDTTAFSAAMRYDEEMLAYLRARRPGDIVTAPPAVAEIEYGIRRLPENSKRRTLLERERDRLLGTVRVLEWTPRASEWFGTIKAHLEHQGTMIDDLDVAIAAVAAAHDAVVVTANLVHFRRLPGVSSTRWRE
jgi:tRNA(fMet)-specific endonuclease VapC